MRYRLHSALMVAHGKYLRNLARSAQANGLFHGQPKVLEYISGHDGCTQIDVCKAWDIDKSTMSGLVTRLLRNGLIQCERDWLDRRRTKLRITEKGRTCWEAMEKDLDRLEENAWAGIGPEEKEAFMQTIRKVCENLDRVERGEEEAL